jgi:hypothetical protein
VSHGFHLGCGDIGATERFVVYPGRETYPLNENTLAVPLHALTEKVRGAYSGA